MSNEIAVRAPSSDLAIEPEQLGFTDAQVAALRQLGVDNVPDAHLQVFFHQAKRTGLDPFAKQIYMIGRKTKSGMQYTIQTGIDGYRVTGHRAAAARGDSVSMGEPLWYNPEAGAWQDVWFDRRPPAAAKITLRITRADGRVETVAATANYNEYVQTTKDFNTGQQVPNSMWSKMPANQLVKCAEAAVWRKAYPQDFSGLVLEDAAQNTVIDAEPVTSPRRVEAAAILNPEPAAEPDADGSGVKPEPRITAAQSKKLHAMLNEAGLGNRDDGLAWIGQALDREVATTKTLTADEASHLFDALDRAINYPAAESESQDVPLDGMDEFAQEAGE